MTIVISILCDYKLEDGYMIPMQVRKPLEDLPTSTNGATSSTKASSPVKAATEKEPEKPNEKDEEARLSREEEKQVTTPDCNWLS